MMKSIILTALAAFMAILPANARFNGANREAPAAHIGIRAGVGGSEYSDIDRPEALATAFGGIHLDFKVAKLPLYVETGAYYMDMGTKFRDRWYRDRGYSVNNRYRWGYDNNWEKDYRYDEIGRYYRYESGSEGWRDTDHYTLHNHSIMVPLALSYHIYLNDNLVLQPFTGVFGSYGFTSEEWDFGLRDGIALSFGHFNAGIGVNIGLLDQKQKTKDVWVEDAHHVSAYIALGINF